MRTPITYYGGKQQLADTIIGMMPSHKIYCEPYFGGGAVFFAKGKSYLEVINDIDDRIITFYDVCQDEEKFLKLQQKIQNTLDSEREFMRADKIWRHPENGYSDIETAWAVWYQCNMGYGGSPLGGWKWDNGTSGSHAGIVMDNYRNQFNYKVHERLKHVQISCRDALKVIAQRDSEDTFFFLDPPILVVSRNIIVASPSMIFSSSLICSVPLKESSSCVTLQVPCSMIISIVRAGIFWKKTCR